MENSWSNFNIGSWVLYELSGGIQQKQILINKTDTEITLKVEIVINGNTVSVSEMKIPLDVKPSETPESHVETKEYSDKIEIKGETLSCKLYEVDSPQGIGKSWISDKIPGGVVQAGLNDTVTMRLLEYEIK